MILPRKLGRGCVLCSALVTMGARGQTSDASTKGVSTLDAEIAASSSAAVAPARALFDRGLDALARGDTVVACSLFERSEEIEPAPHTLLQLGRCAESSGELLRAQGLFERALELGLQAPEEQVRQAYTKAARELLVALAKLIPTLTVEAPLAPNAAVRLLDAAGSVRSLGLGERLQLDPGTYRLETVAAGELFGSEPIVLRPGESLSVTAPGPGSADMAPPPGAPPPVPTQHASEPQAPWRLLLSGAGVAMAGVGLGLGLHAHSIERGVRRRCPTLTDCSRDLRSDAERFERYDGAATALIGTGAAATLAGLVWLWARPPATATAGPARPLSAEVLPAPGGFTAQVQARF